jgi:hyperosmotically inducible periplasmic protein
MNTKILVAAIIAASTYLPIASYGAEDMDKDRSSAKVWVKDSIITTKIKTELAAKKLSSLAHIKVDTDANGYVLLSGNARTVAEVSQAESIAKGVQGVKSVENRIQVKADL